MVSDINTAGQKKKANYYLNRRQKILLLLILSGGYLAAIAIGGIIINPAAYGVDYSVKLAAPSFRHLFGTDYLGRDMFCRTIKGLSNSIFIGLLASFVSACISLTLGISSGLIGGKYDRLVNWCVDLCMGIPHLILLLLISFSVGRGVKGVIIGVAFTHWPELTRVIRAEVWQLRNETYILAAEKFGKSRWEIAKTHILPHVWPEFFVGLVLLFPHAIMHEAAITFLGFGLPLEMPAVGVILSEAMKHVAAGKWWLVLYPGLLLLSVVVLFDVIGENLKKLFRPASANE